MYASYCDSHGDVNVGSLLAICEWYDLVSTSVILLSCLSPHCKFCHTECALSIFSGSMSSLEYLLHLEYLTNIVWQYVLSHYDWKAWLRGSDWGYEVCSASRKGDWGMKTDVYNFVMRGSGEESAYLFSLMSDDRVLGNGLKLNQGKFQQGI